MKNDVRPCYNKPVMDRITPKLWFLRMVLGLAFLIGLFPISHVLSMQSGQMPIPSQNVERNGGMPRGQNIPTPCCNDTFSSFSSMCGFMIPDSACAAYPAGANQVALATFSIQIGKREIVTPPPKI